MRSAVITLPLFVVSDCICVGGKIGVLQIAARKRERGFERDFSMTRLTRGSGWARGNVLHRAAGS